MLIRLMRACAPIAIQVVLASITLRLGIFLLELWSGMGAVGTSASASRLAEAPLFVTAAVSATLLPVIASSFALEPEKAFAAGRVALGIAAILLAPLCVVVTIYSHDIVTLIYTRTFLDAAVPLSIQIWATPVMLFNTILSTLVIAAGAERRLVRITVVMFIASVVLNVVCIRLWSIAGLAAAVVGTQLSGAICYVALCMKSWPAAIPSGWRRLLGVLALLYAIAWMTQRLPYALGVPLSVGAYLVMLFLTGLVRPDMWHVMVVWLRRAIGQVEEGA